MLRHLFLLHPSTCFPASVIGVAQHHLPETEKASQRSGLDDPRTKASRRSSICADQCNRTSWPLFPTAPYNALLMHDCQGLRMPRKRWGLEIAASDERWVESLPSLCEVGDKRRKLLGHEQGEHRYAESIEEKSKREALSPSCATTFSNYTVLPSESAYCSRPSRFPSPRTHLKAPKSSSNGQIAEPRSLVGPLSSLKQPLFADRLHNALVTGRERAGDAGTNLGNPNCAIYAAGQPPSPRDRATVCSAPRPVVEEPLSDDEDSVVARENALSGRSRAGLTTRVSSSSENHGWSSASLGGESARAGRAISFESHAAFWNSREVCIFRVRQSPVDKYNPTEPGWKNREATSLNTEKASGLERQTPADRRWSAQGGEITPARIDEPSSSDEEQLSGGPMKSGMISMCSSVRFSDSAAQSKPSRPLTTARVATWRA